MSRQKLILVGGCETVQTGTNFPIGPFSEVSWASFEKTWVGTLPWLNRLFLIHIFGLSQEFPVQFNEKSGFLSPHKIFGTVFDFPQIWRKLWALATNLIWLETFLVQKVSPLFGLFSICTTHYLTLRVGSGLSCILGDKKETEKIWYLFARPQSNYLTIHPENSAPSPATATMPAHEIWRPLTRVQLAESSWACQRPAGGVQMGWQPHIRSPVEGILTRLDQENKLVCPMS